MSKPIEWIEKHYGKLVIISLHALAWFLYLTFYRLTYVQQGRNSEYVFFFILSIVVTDAPVFYYFYFRAIPRLLIGKKVWKFLLISLLVTLNYPLVRYGFDHLFLTFYPHDLTPISNIAVAGFNVVFGIRALAALFVIAMAGIGKFTFDWFENARIRRELENQNLTSELAFLKSQINPHFLFNTLNNIHTLAYKKADGAPEAIMKLSELMRYMLYESDMSFVPLDKEIQHLRSFIGLQELRFKAKDIVTLEVTGDTQGVVIAPLLLLPFIENAFKHGYQLNRTGAIKVKLNVSDQINYEVENEISIKQKEQMKDQVGGIGLENIQRRLKLIYPDRHTFSVNESSNSFNVSLTLKWNG